MRLGPLGVVQYRQGELERIRNMAEDLEPKENKLKAELHPDVKQVVQSKRLCLFNRLLEDIGFEDLDAAKSMATGLGIVGPMRDSLAFPQKSMHQQGTRSRTS